MGYDIKSFDSLFEGLIKFKPGTTGNHVFKHFWEQEQKRLDVEAFIGLKIESTITKICNRQDKYIELYREYKKIARMAQEEFEKSLKN